MDAGAVLGKTFGGPGPPKIFPSLPFSLLPPLPLKLSLPSLSPLPLPSLSPSLPFPYSSYFPSPPFPLSFHSLPLPSLPLEVGPLNPARGSGGAL